jgi:hypothetical protein
LNNVIEMHNWLKSDLEKADKNRLVTPWIVVFGHRPMYCAKGWWDCSYKHTKTQVGLEELLHTFSVDLAFWAHVHTYQRMWPVYNYKVYKTESQPYVNPEATVHFVIASGVR